MFWRRRKPVKPRIFRTVNGWRCISPCVGSGITMHEYAQLCAFLAHLNKVAR